MQSIFWPTALGAAIGVISGVFIQFLCQLAVERLSVFRIRKSLSKEFSFNLRVMEDIETALRQFRNAINGDAPENALTFIPVNKGLHLQFNDLINRGRLYDFFDETQLRLAQEMGLFLSPANATWLSTELDKRKAALLENPRGPKGEILSFLDFADRKAAETRAGLNRLISDFR